MASEQASAAATQLPQYDHMNPLIGRDGTPYAYYEALRDAAAASGRYILWSEHQGGFWAVIGYEEIAEIARNTEAFSNSEPTLPRYATTEPLMIAGQDDPEHRLARALVNAPFGPLRVKVYADTIRENLNLLVDSFIERGRADLARLVAVPIPAIVTALLLGLPAEDGPKFSRWIGAVAGGHLNDPAQAAADIAAMYAYFERTIAARRREPGQDVLSHVVNAEVDGRRFTQQELLGFCTTLMIGGIDNTNRLLSTMLWRLGWDFPLRHRLLRYPALMPKAVDEFLRFHSPASTCRLVKHDISLGGVTMKTGQMVLLVHPIANRDARTFAYPDSFIPEREQNRHLGLGIGIHRCLGAHLIAMEARVVLDEFLKRLPEYSLDPERPPKWMSGQVSGMVSVPVRFAPGRPLHASAGNAGVAAWLEAAAAETLH